MSGDERAYLFYLLLFLLFIGGSVLFSRRHRMGQTLQQAAVWALIFVGIIIAYGFKDTLQTQLFPSHARQVGNGSYVLERFNDGHFYLTLEVNGQNVDFIVDTGASDIVLTQKDARKIGLEPDDLIYLGRANTANGTVRTATVVLDSVRLGEIVDNRIRAAVTGGKMEESLLGMTYLRRFDNINIRGDTMTLTR